MSFFMNGGLNFFDAILYINLDHREDRKLYLLNELERLGVAKEKIHRISAVHDPLNGHRGCAQSHANAVEYAIGQGFKTTLILEDDFVCTKSPSEINTLITHFTKVVENSWDVFLIGGNIQKFEKTTYPNVNRALNSLCAHAYVINNHYLPLLKTLFLYCVSQMENELFFRDSIPHAIDQMWNYLMIKDKWYFVEIFGQQNASFSDINHAVRDRRHQEAF